MPLGTKRKGEGEGEGEVGIQNLLSRAHKIMNDEKHRQIFNQYSVKVHVILPDT